LIADSVSVLQICSAREAIYGAVQSLLTLVDAQRAAGTRVEFLTFEGKKFGEQVRERSYQAHEVKVRGKIDPVAIFQMAEVIRRGGYDVVHTHLSTSSVNGALAARLARVPCVATVHGMSGKLSFAAANHLIAVSNGVKSHLVKQGVSPSKVSVVYNGVDVRPARLDREESRRLLGIPENVPVVGTVARITALKGIEDALYAVAAMRIRYPELRYLVVGEGDALPAARELARSLRIEDAVDFVGFRTDIDVCLAAMDLFLFPTHKEAMGIALVEAMAAGLPAVATEVGGIPEVVTPQTGILVPPHDPPALADAALQLLSDPVRMFESGQAAKRRAEEVFSTAAMEEATDQVYRKLIEFGPREEPSMGDRTKLRA
jgi:glycosyltransferase involved in cell wall biosynthesis